MRGTFGTSYKSIADFMELCKKFVRGFVARVHRKMERTPYVEVRSAFTFARSAIGWSGKVMENQLSDARAWANAALEEEVRRVESLEELQYTYDGVQLDGPDERPLIQGFFDHAEWFLHNRVRDWSIRGLMLRVMAGGGYLPKKDIYVDRVVAARYYIHLYGVD